jgi:hypothetical protein
LNFFYALDYLVFKDFLTVFNISNLLGRGPVITCLWLQVGLAVLAEHHKLSFKILVVLFFQICEVVFVALTALDTGGLFAVEV